MKMVAHSLFENPTTLAAGVTECGTIDHEAKSAPMIGEPPVIPLPEDDLLPLGNATEAFWAPSHHVVSDYLIEFVDDNVKNSEHSPKATLFLN